LANTGVLIFFIILPYLELLEGVQIEGYMVMLIISTCFIWLPLTMVAFLLKFNRMYIYAIIGGFAFFISDLLRDILTYFISTIIIFGITGGSIFIIGLITFINFIKKYPKQESEVSK
jgi:hypothetical protein